MAFSEFTRKRHEMEKAVAKRSLVPTPPQRRIGKKKKKQQVTATTTARPVVTAAVPPIPLAEIPVVQFTLRRTA
jgi:hypothetical protein